MPAFSQWSDEQLNSYLLTEVIPHISGREAHLAEFGPVYGQILNEMLGLLAVQEIHRLLTCEAQDLVKSAFRMRFRRLASKTEQQQAVRYREEVAKVAAEEARVRGEQLQRQTERRAAEEKARIAQIAVDEGKRHRDAVARNLAAEAELAATRAREDGAFVERQSR
jgi:hypothetical protein